ncbi:MAG: anti-sigma F factor [Clostridia bacterium]|nr:anti-sigma F factor [Clostridia bacterium]
MNFINEMNMTIQSHSINEGFARSVVAAFCVQLNPSLDEIADIKTAVSEAVTNCVVHAYPDCVGEIAVWVGLGEDRTVHIKISDFGVGIEDFNLAREPFFTTKASEERAGMGFTVMESFMDEVTVCKNGEKGVIVYLVKKLSNVAKKAQSRQAND